MSNAAKQSLMTGYLISYSTTGEFPTREESAAFDQGMELQQVVDHCYRRSGRHVVVIHRANETRARWVCDQYGRECSVELCQADEDPQGIYARLMICPGDPGRRPRARKPEGPAPIAGPQGHEPITYEAQYDHKRMCYVLKLSCGCEKTANAFASVADFADVAADHHCPRAK